MHDFEVKNHAELAEDLDIVDFDSSAKTSGTGFFYLKGNLALLNQALIRYGIDYMIERGYTLIEPPLMIKKRYVMVLSTLSFSRIWHTKLMVKNYILLRLQNIH